MAKVVFKNQTGNSPELFPVNIFDRIPDNHPVRLVDTFFVLRKRTNQKSQKRTIDFQSQKIAA
jgi:hypothetical protein